ncbi:redoxin domain-containing protein [Patulibacter minatonensis]|uniref:redoxin domain-containing protein n=1 Tax=Patulibacter minatonensis TaxID=298163 RepID=UPI0004786CBE|nr:redoxin domain-containing protein [Patulibacter minatonensis]
MLLLILFGFVAGAATAVSPCVLPVLPIVLAGGASGGRRRPLGIVVGLVATFTISVVVLAYVISALGLPDNVNRYIAIVTLVLVGIVLLVPPLSVAVEGWISRIAPAPKQRIGEGFGTGVVLGAGLGFVYLPCAGPILTGVITASSSQSFDVERLLIALAYGAGSGLVLYAIMLGGRRLTRPLAKRTGSFQMAMGGIMVLVALAMITNYDRDFTNSIGKNLPQALVTPTQGLEKSSAVQSRLRGLRGEGSLQKAARKELVDGLDPTDLPILGRVPPITGTQQWFNTDGKPLTFAGLERQRKVVLVDFWTYTCINCLRTIPALNSLYRKYEKDGLQIIGIHSPEFPFEKSATSVKRAIAREKIKYPVVQDNDLKTWDAFQNQAWPAQYLVDSGGNVRYTSEGEGHDDTTEKAIRTLLDEAGRTPGGRSGDLGAIEASTKVGTPESYLGNDRSENIVGGKTGTGTRTYGEPPAKLPRNGIAFGGAWTFAGDHATARSGSRLALDFTSEHVYLVLRSRTKDAPVGVSLDGAPVPAKRAGADVRDGTVKVGTQRLYELLDLRRAGHHRLDLTLPPGVEAYAFTFG